MDIAEYKDYLKETLNAYPKYMQMDFINALREQSLVSTDSRKKNLSPEISDISSLPFEERIKHVIDFVEGAIQVFENVEHIRGYKHSVLFRYEDKHYSDILQLLKSCNYVIDDTDELEELTVIPHNAYIKICENMTTLKFVFRYDKLDPNGNPVRFKYSVIVAFFESNNLVDVRFDRLSRSLFGDVSDVYNRNIMLIKNWFVNNIGITLINLDLPLIADSIKTNEDNVVPYAQSMNPKTGGEAVLRANDNYVLPFLGDLRKLMEDNKELFDNASEVKDLLQDFISDIEETSDLPWITLCWKGENKSKDIHVKFLFDYAKKGYTLLQYTGLSKDMERMNKIVECVARHMDNNTEPNSVIR